MDGQEEFIARFKARASHAAQVQSRVKKLEKIDRVEIQPEEQSISFQFPVPVRGGDEVLSLNNLSKTWLTPSGIKKTVLALPSFIKKETFFVIV